MSNTQKTTFYLVRHGETNWNVQKIMQGHKDLPLNDNGISQAQERAKNFAEIKFNRVFASDLMRASKTAELLVAEKNLAVAATKLLREMTFGPYEGYKVKKFREELCDQLAEANKLKGEARLKYRLAKEIETLEEAAQRALRFLRETALAYPGETILAVSHGGIIRSLLLKLGWIDDFASWLEIGNLAYVILESDGIDFFIRETKDIKIKEQDGKEQRVGGSIRSVAI